MTNFRSSRTDFADAWVCMHFSFSLLVDSMLDHACRLPSSLATHPSSATPARSALSIARPLLKHMAELVVRAD